MRNKRKIETLCKYYILVLLFGVFALNTGSTFEDKNYVFISIIVIGFLFILVSIYSNFPKLKIDKFTIWLIVLYLYWVTSSTWATSSYLAIRQANVLLLTLVIIYIINTLIVNSNVDLYDMLGYIVLIGILTYVFLIYKYGFSIIWNLRYNSVSKKLYNANHMAMLDCFCCICAYLRYKNFKKEKKFLVIAIIMLIFTLCCASKTAIIFITAYIPCVIILNNQNKIRKTLQILSITLLIILLYFSMMKVKFLYDSIGWRFEEVLEFLNGDLEVGTSTWYRSNMYKTGIELFISKPIFGYGMGNAALYSKFNTYLHSNIVELLADTGIVGTIIYYYMYIKILKTDKDKTEETEKEKIISNFTAITIALFIIDFFAINYDDRITILMLDIIYLTEKNIVPVRKEEK